MKEERNKISRVTRSKEEARQYYNKLSKCYDYLSGGIEYKISKTGLENLNIQREDTILEIGFGTGKILKKISELDGFAGEIFGIDISEGMLKKTESRFEENERNRITLICGDAENLPFDNEKFDKIFMSFTLELFDTPEIPAVLKECNRVLKSKGKISVVSMSRGKMNIMERVYEWAHDKFPKQIDCRPIYTKQAVEEADFKIEKVIEKSMFGLPVDIVIGRKK